MAVRPLSSFPGARRAGVAALALTGCAATDSIRVSGGPGSFSDAQSRWVHGPLGPIAPEPAALGVPEARTSNLRFLF